MHFTIWAKYNHHMVLEKMVHILKNECNLRSGQPVLAGVSGGPDSLTLLDGLARSGYRLITAHLDHMLRPESGDDVKQLEKMLQDMGFSLITGQVNVEQYARSESMSIEEAARHARYHFLFEQARKHGCQAVAVGHNADDQAETVLMHFLRGTGSSGLLGMSYCEYIAHWDAEIPLIRPLLDTWRSEINEYCLERDLTPIIDESNTSTDFLRNRVRNQLIPELERTYNPQFKKAVWRLANIMQGDAVWFQPVIEETWNEICREQTSATIRLDVSRFEKMSKGMQRNLIRLAIQNLIERTEEISFDVIERGLQVMVASSTGKEIQLTGGINLFKMKEELVFYKEGEENWLEQYPQVYQPISITSEGEYVLGGGWFLQCHQVSIAEPGEIPHLPADPFHAHIDAGGVEFPLLLRNPQPGERFRPYGLNGQSMKISDFFINEKLPRKARLNYPVVCSQDQVMWIPGFRIANFVQVTNETREIISLQIFRQ